MTPGDSDARVLEQFLRTMAPSAALTAVYRQQVVRASLDARSKVLRRRRTQGLVLAAVCACFAMWLPGFLLIRSLERLSSSVAVAESPANSAPLPGAVDGYELSLMRAHSQFRVQSWLASQQAGNP